MKFVSKYGKLAALALALALPIVATLACSSLKPQVQSGIDAAKKVSADAGAIIEQAKAVATTLPSDDPLRQQAEQRIAQVEKIKADADKYIAASEGVLKSIDSGSLDPTAATVIGSLPYGNYAVAGVSLLLFALQRAKASGAIDDLTKVVKSWEEVGPDLSPEEKAKAAAIQGPKTSARVDDIKASL
jgi:putative sterol carrier protein